MKLTSSERAHTQDKLSVFCHSTSPSDVAPLPVTHKLIRIHSENHLYNCSLIDQSGVQIECWWQWILHEYINPALLLSPWCHHPALTPCFRLHLDTVNGVIKSETETPNNSTRFNLGFLIELQREWMNPCFSLALGIYHVKTSYSTY